MPSGPIHIDSPAVAGQILRSRFQQVGQLVEHALCVCHAGGQQRVAASWQHSQMDDWPASPPLQSWQVAEDHHGRPLLLSTGLAGTSHWSLAVSITAAGGLLFDVACRAGQSPQFLGSTYEIALPFNDYGYTPPIEGSGRVHLRVVGGSDFGTRLERGSAADQLQLCPTLAWGDGRETVRWAYELQIEPT